MSRPPGRRLGGAVLPILACLVVVGANAPSNGATAAYSSRTGADSLTFGARACYPKVPLDSPVLHYSYNEPSGGTVEDGSANANNGAMQGTAARVVGTCSTDRAGGYLHLDGASIDGGGVPSLVTTPVTATNPTTFSLETWFRTTTATKGVMISFGDRQNYASSSSYDRILYMAPGGQMRFGVYDGGVHQVTASGTWNDGAWHHAVGTFSPTTGVRLYLDGSLAASNSSYTSAVSYTGWWRIGQESLNGWDGSVYQGEPFTGDLDDTAVYSSCLTAGQVSNHFSAGR